MAPQAHCFVGTSGWIYPHWRGIFYPADLAQSAWFGHYARFFSTVEVNFTFYRFPSEKAFQAWKDNSPKGFLFALKASRYLTHVRKLRDPESPLANFLGRSRLLGEKIGPVLYQLPPNWRADLGRLQAFLELLPGDLTHVFEFRDPSWLCEPVFQLLEHKGAGFCIASMPDFPCPIRATGPSAYLRMHGSHVMYGDRYTLDELRWWVEKIRSFLAEGRDVYVYFNNDWEGHAVRNALELKDLLSA